MGTRRGVSSKRPARKPLIEPRATTVRVRQAAVSPRHRWHGMMSTAGFAVVAVAILAFASWSQRVPAGSDNLPGGFPSSIDGRPVLVGLSARVALADAPDDRPLLIGGYYDSTFIPQCGGGGILSPESLDRGCPRYVIDGIEGRIAFPPDLQMPPGDGPIVLSVHTHDQAAKLCDPASRCEKTVVVEGVAWADRSSRSSQPLGPSTALRRLLSLPIVEVREQSDGSFFEFWPDLFRIPRDCGAGWPSLTFSVHGDARLAILAVFPDPGQAGRFLESVPPEVGAACLPGRPTDVNPEYRWVAHENVLVLVASSDETFESAVKAGLAEHEAPTIDIARTDTAARAALYDYLEARAAGEFDHAWPQRLVYLGEVAGVAVQATDWFADARERSAQNGLFPRKITETAADPQANGRVAQALQHEAGRHPVLFRVEYSADTPEALREELYVVFETPSSGLRDWAIARIDDGYWATPAGTGDASQAPPSDPACGATGQECP